MMKKIKLLLADDHRIFRDGLKSLLSDDLTIEIIAEVSSGDELFIITEPIIPDIILMDITMPGKNGLEVCQEIILKYPCIRVIILSMHTDETFVMKAIQAGALGYLPKDTSKEELLEAIHTVARGDSYFSQAISNKFLKRFSEQSRKEKELSEAMNLTPREIEILSMVATGLDKHEISGKLFISVKTVDCHKANLMQKLQLKNTAELVLFAVKNKIIEV